MVTLSSRTKQVSFLLLNSLIGASLIYFLVSTFVLRIFYSISFFLFSFFLQDYIFSDLTLRVSFKRRPAFFSSLKKILTSTYMWGIFASLIILLIPSYPFPVYSEGIYLSFLSLSPILVLRVVSGFYIAAFFPGKIIYDLFLKSRYNFDRFEELGFTVVISYIFCTTLGLILLRATGDITSFLFVVSLWLIILPAITYKIIKKTAFKREPIGEGYVNIHYSKWGILLLLSVVLLFSSYLIHMFSQPMYGIYSGDLRNYLKMANEFVNFGSIFSPYLWFQVYMKITSIITGLPLLYSLAGLQFFVLLPVIAFYMLMKALFPKYSKCPTVTAAFIFVQGLVALPTVGIILTRPALYTEYMNGDISSLLNGYIFGIGAQGATWISVFVNLIEISMGALAFVFAYRYFSAEKHNGSLTDMFLAALFLITTVFSHGIFLLPLFFFSLTLFLLVRNVQSGPRKLLLFIGTTILLFFVLDFLNGWHFLFSGNQTSSYFLTRFWTILPAIVIPVYIKEKIHTRIDVKISVQITPRSLGKNLLWMFSLTIFFVSLAFGILYWGSPLNAIRYASFPHFFPWYVYVLSYGFPLIVAIGALPLLVKIDYKRPLTFILCWLFSLICFGLFGPYLLTFVFPSLPQTEAIIFNRFVIYIVYLTSGLGAIVLSNYKPSIKAKLFGRLNFSSRKIIPLIFTVAVAMSFLFIPYGTEYFWHVGSPSEYYNSSMEATALTWINLNIADNSTILTLSDSSYQRLIAQTRLKVIPSEILATDLSFASMIEEMPIVDDQQSSFWKIEHAGSGDIQILVNDDPDTKMSGTDSLKMNVTKGGLWTTWYLWHEYSSALDWSAQDTIFLNFYGMNSGKILSLQLWTPDINNRGSFTFKDDFVGWQKITFPIEELASIGTFDWSNIKIIKISPTSVSNTAVCIFHVDLFTVARHFIDEVSIKTFLYTYLEPLQGSYIYASFTDFSALEPKTQATSILLSHISDFPIAYENEEVTIYKVPLQ